VFLPPGDMVGRVVAEAGLPGDASPAVVARCIVDSLALAHSRAVELAQQLSGRSADAVHIVGDDEKRVLRIGVGTDPQIAARPVIDAFGGDQIGRVEIGCRRRAFARPLDRPAGDGQRRLREEIAVEAFPLA